MMMQMKIVNLVLLLLLALTPSRAQFISECSITPTIVDGFEDRTTNLIADFRQGSILNGYGLITNSEGSLFKAESSGVLIPNGNYLYGAKSQSISEIEFSESVQSFGGYFGVFSGSGNINFRFFDALGGLIDSGSISYDFNAENGFLKKVYFCTSANLIKNVLIFGTFAIDDIGVTFPGDFTTNAQAATSSELTTADVTSSEITSSLSEITSAYEMTTGRVNINSCSSFSSKLTESFEDFDTSSGRYSYRTGPILSGFGQISNSHGYVVRLGWSLGPTNAKPAEGAQFYGSDGIGRLTTITFESPIKSFGAHVASSEGSADIEISFYATDDSLIDTKYERYNPFLEDGFMKAVRYCSSNGDVIKKVTISGEYHTIDAILVRFSSEFTTGEITSAEITSSEITSSEITSSEITSSKITSASITSSEITSFEITSSEITSLEITSSEITSSKITTSAITSYAISSAELSSGSVTSSSITSNQMTTAYSVSTTQPEITSSSVSSSHISTSINEITSNQYPIVAVTSNEISTDRLTTQNIQQQPFTTSITQQQQEITSNQLINNNPITSNAMITSSEIILEQTTNEDEDGQVHLSQADKDKLNKKNQKNTIIRAVFIPVGIFLFGVLAVLVYRKTNLFNKFKNKEHKNKDNIEMAAVE